MRIGVVSDTHGHTAYTGQAVEALRQRNVDAVLHCGDIGSADIIPLFADWPTHFVFGNVDHHADALRAVIEACGQTCHGRFGALEFEGRKVALLHSDDHRLFRETIASSEWDLVCYGHTHVVEQHREGQTLVLNPGALYRASRHTFAVVEFPALDVEIIAV